MRLSVATGARSITARPQWAGQAREPDAPAPKRGRNDRRSRPEADPSLGDDKKDPNTSGRKPGLY